jgi:hypothetical protein
MVAPYQVTAVLQVNWMGAPISFAASGGTGPAYRQEDRGRVQ